MTDTSFSMFALNIWHDLPLMLMEIAKCCLKLSIRQEKLWCEWNFQKTKQEWHLHDRIWEPSTCTLLPLAKNIHVRTSALSTRSGLPFSNAGFCTQHADRATAWAECQQWWTCRQESLLSLHTQLLSPHTWTPAAFLNLKHLAWEVLVFRPQSMEPLQGMSDQWKKRPHEHVSSNH